MDNTVLKQLPPPIVAPPVEQSTIEGEAPLPAFIESNTSAITLDELERDCIIPTFADLNPTISHQSFIKTITEAAAGFFSNYYCPLKDSALRPTS